jgi:Fe-S-cluster containining protein
MSKKQGKGKTVKVRDFKRNSKPAKKNRSKITLRDKLDEIYYSSVCLDTTCQGRCECCKTAMPQMNYCEFCQLADDIWRTTSRSEQIRLICSSIEYFFRNEFEKWGKESLIKPCLLLAEDGKCRFYQSRPLSCRMYGLWPEATYNARVDKFEKAYDGLLKREELPLNKQCPYVKRVDETVPLTDELISHLYKQLDELDKKVGDYTDLKIEQKENYRTFHDWLLLKIFGEGWLVNLTQFMMGATRPVIEEQISAIKKAVVDTFSKDMPNLRSEI